MGKICTFYQEAVLRGTADLSERHSRPGAVFSGAGKSAGVSAVPGRHGADAALYGTGQSGRRGGCGPVLRSGATGPSCWRCLEDSRSFTELENGVPF